MTIQQFKPAELMIFSTVETDRIRLLHVLRQKKMDEIVIDLSQVTQCDSAGLAFLIEAKRLSIEFKKSFKITGAQDVVQALAQFYGVEKIILKSVQ